MIAPLATPLAIPYLDALAAPTPTPGGGSAAAVTAAMGCALLSMVGGISRNIAHPAADARLAAGLQHLEGARMRALSIGADDEHAYAGYRTAAALPRVSTAERESRRIALAEATILAAAPPLDLVQLIATVLDAAVAILPDLSPYLRADVVAASWLLQAAAQAAAAMIDVNVASMKDPSSVAAWTADAATAAAAFERALSDLRAALAASIA